MSDEVEYMEDAAPEGQEVLESEEHAEVDLIAGDEAPEGEGDWAEAVDEEHGWDMDGDENGDVQGEEELEEGGEMADVEEQAADGEEAEKEGNGVAGEEYEVVDELQDAEMDDHLDELGDEQKEDVEKNEDAEKKEEKPEGEAKKDVEKKESHPVIRGRRPFFIPTVHEYRMEVRQVRDNATVLMGPIQFCDLSETKLTSHIGKTQKVSIKFGKQNESDDFAGYLEMVFFKEEDAVNCAKSLADLREGFKAEHTHKDNKSKEIGGIREYGDIYAGLTGETTLVVPEITSKVNEEEIQAQIPEAKAVFLPDKTASQKLRYAYIEVEDKETAAKVEGRELTFEEDKFKIYKLEDIASFSSVIKHIRSLNMHELTARLPLEAKRRTQLYRLSLAVTHYMRANYLHSGDKDMLKQAAEPLRHLLREDSNRTGRRGRPYIRGGSRSTYRGSYRSDYSSSGRGYDDRYAPKRHYDDFDRGESKRSRSDYHEGGRSGPGGDVDTRSAMDLLVGLTSMLKGRSSSGREASRGHDEPRDSRRAPPPPRVSTGASRTPSSSYRESGSSNYRGANASYHSSRPAGVSRGGASAGSNYRGGAARGASTTAPYRSSVGRGTTRGTYSSSSGRTYY